MRARVAIAAALAIVCLILPVPHARSRRPPCRRSPARWDTPTFSTRAHRPRRVRGGLEWVPTRHIAVGPEMLYMRGPGDDRDLFLVGVARFGILPLRSRVAPFVTAGGGGMMTHSDDYGGMSYSSTEGAFILGGGVAHQCHSARLHRAGIHDGMGAAHAVLGHRRRPVSVRVQPLGRARRAGAYLQRRR